jgi:tungstate transport system ATP-binding protein
MYTLHHVQQQYNGRVVLDVDRLTVHQGEVLAIVGPSGAGKSTLLRLLAFLEAPARGEMRFNGRAANESWPDLEARRKVTMVFQRPQLLRRSVWDNVIYGWRIRGQSEVGGQVTDVLARLGLTDLAQAKAQTLSGGEMQRVALARALILHPDVLLLDEPTANLDPYNIKLIEQMVTEANKQGTTIIIVTHNIFQARRLAQRTGLLLNGRLIEVAPTETFFERPSQPETAAFVRGDIIY